LKLPGNAIIAREKITVYLLKPRPDNDKSQFLKREGYSTGNWRQLERDIRNQILPLESEFLERTAYGELWKIRGRLEGPNGVTTHVVTIWMKEKYTGLTKLITLLPDREGRA